MSDPASQADYSSLDARSGSARFVLSDDGLSYRCERVFGAPPGRVFRAFTDPADLGVWFPAGAPAGSEMTVCESDPVIEGRYHYEMVITGFGKVSWHGVYTRIDPPNQIDAQEWFIMGDGEPSGPPTTQTLTFEPVGDGLTKMTMTVNLVDPEDPETFMEQSAAGLSSSLNKLDELVSS